VAERREIFDEAPGVSLMSGEGRELLISFTENRAVPHCYIIKPKSSPTAVIKNHKIPTLLHAFRNVNSSRGDDVIKDLF